MLKEAVRVVAIETGSILVEARRKSHCQACSLRSACGHGLLEKIRRDPDNRLRIPLQEGRTAPREGDEVILAVSDSLVLKLSLLFYLLPLAGLLAGSLAAALSGAAEFTIALAGLGGLAGAFLLARHWAELCAARGEFQAHLAEAGQSASSLSPPSIRTES